MAVKLLIDSTNYLPVTVLEHFDLRQVSLFINDGGIHDCEVDLDYGDFYRRLADTQEIPKSAQPSPESVRIAMESILDEGDEVLGLTLSSVMSGTYDTFCMVASQIKTERPGSVIEVVDTRSNCLQEGYAILSAAEKAAGQASIARCIAAANHSIARSRFVFAPHGLEYLERGGRIGTASALIGSLLKIIPILTVENGETTQLGKVRTYPKALLALRDKLAADMVKGGGIERVDIHSIADSQHAKKFRDELIEPLVGRKVDITPIGPVIGAHVGPAVGLVYETKNPLR